MPYSPVATPNFPAGYPATPANFTTWVQDSLGFATAGTMFRGQRVAAQSLSATTYNIIDFDTIAEDPYSGWSATSTGSQAAFSYLVPFTGWYQILVTACIATLSTTLGAAISITGNATQLLQAEVLVSNQNTGGATGTVTLPLTGGFDYVQGQAWVGNAATTNTTSTFPTTMEILFIST